jgi:hypothetical protein
MVIQNAKKSLVNILHLGHPSESAELSLAVDANNTQVGAVLQQKLKNGVWQPLGFFSKKLNRAQLKYSAFDRELLAVVSGLRHFRFMLEAQVFHILTDHKPLIFALKRVFEPWSGFGCLFMTLAGMWSLYLPMPDRETWSKCPQGTQSTFFCSSRR